MNKKAKIKDILSIKGKDVTLLLLDGVGTFEIAEGQKLVCGNKKGFISMIPMESGIKDLNIKRASVGVKNNVFEIGDVVEIV